MVEAGNDEPFSEVHTLEREIAELKAENARLRRSQTATPAGMVSKAQGASTSDMRSSALDSTWQVGVCDFDPESQVVNLDKWAAKVYGLGAEAKAVPFSELKELVRREDAGSLKQLVADAMEGGTATEFATTYRFRRADTGELRWITTAAESVFEDGKAPRLRGTVRDVTDEVESRCQLAYERDRLAFIKNAWKLGTWEYLVGDDGSVWDARCYEMFGIDEQDLVPLDALKDCIHPDDVDAFSADVERAMDPAGNGIHSMHFRAYNKKTGKRAWYKTRGLTFFEGGAPVRILGAIQDVTDDMTRQEELEILNARLRKSEDRLKLATESGQVGTWEYDPAADTAELDGVAEALFALSAGAKVSLQDLVTRVHPEDQDRLADEITQALVPKSEGRIESSVRIHPDVSDNGTRVAISAGVIPAGDTPVLVTGTIQDVTEAAKAAEDIALMNRELHHRVKNMFATIIGMVRMSARDYPGTEAFAKSLSGRIDALSRAHLISMDRENLAPVDLRQIIDAVLKPYLAPDAAEIRVDGGNYAIPRKSVANVGMILHELATNAVKYGALSAPGGKLNVELKRLEDNTDTPVTLLWREACAEPLTAGPPARKGFGSRLIHASALQLGGRYEPVWSEKGLTASFNVPVQEDKNEKEAS